MILILIMVRKNEFNPWTHRFFTSIYTIICRKVKDRVCFAPVFITYNKLYMYIASMCCQTSVTSVLYH